MTKGWTALSPQSLARIGRADCLLAGGLAGVRRFYRGGLRGSAAALPVALRPEALPDWVQARITTLLGWMDETARLVNEELPPLLPASAPEAELVRLGERLVHLGHALVAWEQEIARQRVPAHGLRTQALLRGMSRPLAEGLFRLADGMASLPARVRAGETVIDLRITLPELPQLAALAAELPRASRAAAPFYQRHPILSALVLHTWLTR